MAQIKTEKQYEAAMARIEELLPLTWGDDVPEDSPENIELALLSDLVAEYEDVVQAQPTAYLSYELCPYHLISYRTERPLRPSD